MQITKKYRESEKLVIDKIHTWLASVDYQYYTINSVPSNSIANKNKYASIIWRQIFRLSPVNFRSFFRLSPYMVDPQATIILSFAYLNLSTSNTIYKKTFEKLVYRIIELRSKKSEFFSIRQNKKLSLKYYKAEDDDISPLLTAWCGELFLEAYAQTKDIKFFDLAKEIKDYFIYEHPKETLNGKIYFYYNPTGNFKIWNASCEISYFLIYAGYVFADKTALDLGKRGIELIQEVQNLDGSWFYGNTRSTHYIDNFHTAFVLRSLYKSLMYIDSDTLQKSFNKGLSFYSKELFKDTKGNKIIPKHFIKKYLPLNSNIISKTDIRDCALSIIFFCEISELDKIHLEKSLKINDYTNSEMRCDNFYAEKTWFWTNKLTYIDFQAWMLYAKSILLKY